MGVCAEVLTVDCVDVLAFARACATLRVFAPRGESTPPVLGNNPLYFSHQLPALRVNDDEPNKNQ